MNLIHILDQQTANSIAAGEVVERPASVVKELVENALDAEASVISIEIRQGGISLIRVTDNGCGMSPDDALLAFARHATSKISHIEDLDSLLTMGFRGEALASIAAVSRVKLSTRRSSDDKGFFVALSGGEMLDSGPAGCPAGTAVTVENLFYNVPARFKFLRKDATEAGLITDMTERLALARPDVSFRLVSNQQEVLHTPGNNDLMSTVYAIYGKQVAAACLPVKNASLPLNLHGLVSRPDASRNSKAWQSFYVNGRLIRSRTISAAIEDACSPYLMKGKYALAILFVEVPPQLVDINVHPQKMEVRFWNDAEVYRLVFHAVQNALHEGGGVAASYEAGVVTASYEGGGVAASPTAGEDSQAGPPAQPLQLGERQNTYSILDSQIATPQQSSPHAQGAETQPDLFKVNELAGCRLIGQAFKTYILLEADQELLLVDQHAAHEKVLFEALMQRHLDMSKTGISGERLLVPLVLEVSRAQMQLLQQNQAEMADLGFLYDFFGERSVALRSLPDAGRYSLQPEAAFRVALDALVEELSEGRTAGHDQPELNNQSLSAIFEKLACHAAVKAHDILDDLEIRRLLDDLSKLDNPYQCPHGRPVIIRLSRRELEKRFKRIV
jgi:DNA mismatch repair protein MutL